MTSHSIIHTVLKYTILDVSVDQTYVKTRFYRKNPRHSSGKYKQIINSQNFGGIAAG